MHHAQLTEKYSCITSSLPSDLRRCNALLGLQPSLTEAEVDRDLLSRLDLCGCLHMQDNLYQQSNIVEGMQYM